MREDRESFDGRIIDCGVGCEASLIIPIGDYNIMILSDDSCGVGKGRIIRSEILIYHKDSKPSKNINAEAFNISEEAVAPGTTENLLHAIDFLKQKECTSKEMNA